MEQPPELPSEIAEAVRTAGARVRIGFPFWLRPFLLPGVVGITLGRTIYLLADFARRPSPDLVRLVRHELAHVEQVNRLTLPVFLLRYGVEFVVHAVRERSIERGYRRISFEREAFEREREDDPTHVTSGRTGL